MCKGCDCIFHIHIQFTYTIEQSSQNINMSSIHYTTCCLCNLDFQTSQHLELHVENSHQDIFAVAESNFEALPQPGTSKAAKLHQHTGKKLLSC